MSIIENYNSLVQGIALQRSIIEDRIGMRERQIKRLRKRLDKLSCPPWKDCVTAIAEELARRTGLKYEICGPFGLNSQISIYLLADDSKGTTEQPTRSLTLMPGFTDEELHLRYWTGESTKEYAPNTIGELNGGNMVTAPLPDTMEEIEALLTSGENG